MAPLIVMLVAWVVARVVGSAGVLLRTASWTGALVFAFAALLVFTAFAHFHPRTRRDLIRMVPASLPAPGVLVTVTGLLELLGAIGLLVPQTQAAAAYALALLLVALSPANIHAARAGVVIAGRRATPLVWRLPLQLCWIGALVWVAQPMVQP